MSADPTDIRLDKIERRLAAVETVLVALYHALCGCWGPLKYRFLRPGSTSKRGRRSPFEAIVGLINK